jgi:hypothetical protein
MTIGPKDLITMVELLATDMKSDDIALAEKMFADIGLPRANVLSMPFGDGWRYFSVMRMPVERNDCTMMARDGQSLAVVHGTDCNMVRRIRQDILDGTQRPFEYCERRLAGGAFTTVDIPNPVG